MPSEPSLAQRSRTARKAAELFAIDARSLAAFRIGLGFLLLVDLWGRAKTLRLHYTGEGVFPRELALALRPGPGIFRVFLVSDSLAVQTALFVVFALVAALLVLGWRTRVMSVLSFVLLASLIRRNPYVCHTGDVLLKALSFWAMFPSLDARRAGSSPVARVLTLATAGTLLQITLFYVMAGYLKSRYDVWRHGDAVWVFTHVVEYTRPFGAWLGQFPLACRGFTYATLVVEGLLPFLFFAPFATARVRTVLFLVYASFHLTLQATIHIGIFQTLCIVMLTLFLPGALWDWLARRLPAGWRARTAADPSAASETRASLAWAARAADVVLAFALVVIVVSNANSAVEDPYDRSDPGLVTLPPVVDDYGRMMSLVQSWNMFTDIDRLFFGWFLVLGQQEDGTIVDVLEKKPFTAPRMPEDYASLFPNHNSRRYWRELTLKDDGQPRVYLLKPMCDSLAREWVRGGGPPLAHLGIFHVGRVPSQARERDQVKPITTEWEATHEPLKSAAPPVQEHWTKLRKSWAEFLANLPKTVAPS
jgi:hypothetical protein